MKNWVFQIMIIVLFSFPLQNCRESLQKNAFILTGTVTDSIDRLFISYDGQEDTILVINNHFSYQGRSINGAIMASIYYESSFADSPNYTNIFLEPGEIKIVLSKNNFKNAKIRGSKIQKEKEEVDKVLSPLTTRFESFMTRRENLLEGINNGSSEATKKWKVLEEEWVDTSNKIREKHLRYAFSNRESHLSSLYLYSYIKFIPKDSVQTVYNRFKPEIKEGYYGLKIAETLGKRELSNVGDTAPFFETKDILGNQISIESYRGKYLLLQFWASWCEPCRKSNPYLIELYEKHSGKFEIVGLTVDKDKDKWKQAIDKDKIGIWPHVDAIETGIDVQYNVLSVPNYLLINPDGVIVYRGQIEGLEEKLKAIKN